MNNKILINTFRFIFLVLLQVLFCNKILFFGYINPIIYIIFIFLYPISKDKTLLLLLSFLLGLSIDFFSNSGGINAAAAVLIAYIRLPLLHIIQNKSEFDYVLFHVKKLSFFQAITYIFSLTFIHHFVVIFLEYYKLNNFFSMIGKTIAVSLFSFIIIAFSIQLFTKESKV